MEHLRNRCKIVAVSIAVGLLPGTLLAAAAAGTERGEQVREALKKSAVGATERFADSLDRPLGVEALDHFEALSKRSFEENVETSNANIRAQLTAFHYGTPEYRRQLAELILGSYLEGGLGWANYLTEPTNVGIWDEKVHAAVGEQGYARVIAFELAFPPGSEAWAHTFGGERRYDPESQTLILNSSPTRLAKGYDRQPRDFAEQVRYGEEIKSAMFRFYSDYREGEVSPDAVRAFNRALVTVGGCAVADTDTPAISRAFARYNAGLNHLAATLAELGYPPGR